MHERLLTLAWFAGTIYAMIPQFWLIAHPFAELLRARRALRYLIIPSWFVMMALVYFLTWQWREVVLYRTPVSWLAADFLFIAAVLVYRGSRLGLSRIRLMTRGGMEPSRERRLVTTGIRQRIRHPIYLSHLLMLLAWTVGSGEIVLYGLTLFALLTGWPMIRQEEADLDRRFGEEYRAYKRAVPAAFIPRVLRVAKEKER
jgi:protein-S-isoprenylcysteine O-methyltransferase Ste14